MDSFGVSYQPAELIESCQNSIGKGHFDCRNCSDADDDIKTITNIYHDENRELLLSAKAVTDYIRLYQLCTYILNLATIIVFML